jgi:flagellar protein FlgJ
MTTPLSLATGQALSASAPAADDRARLHEAAKQFEAIFLRQMLSAARSTDFGGDDLFGGQGEDTFREMRDARFAEIAADSGSIGLAASIEQQLARYIGKA